MALLLIETFYVIYIMEAKPHDDSVFNSLEYFNEGALILLCYMMFVYTGIVADNSILSAKVPLYIQLGIVVAIVVGNFILLVRNGIINVR